MAKHTEISWTHATFNPWRGCVEISPACDNCYAATMSKRNPKVLGTWGKEGTRVLAAESYWGEPLKWNAEAAKSGVRKRVFCASLADVFEDWSGNFPENPPGVHGGVRCMVDHQGDRLCTRAGLEVAKQWPDEAGWRPYTMIDARQRLFDLIDCTPMLDWLLLTKRPENIASMWPVSDTLYGDMLPHLRNVWLGTTVENQEQASKRIPELLKCRALAPVLFLSCEPLLGPVDLAVPWEGERESPTLQVDWVIAGGESGPNARPSNIEWFRSLRDQCDEADVPFHFKQWGEYVGGVDFARDDGYYVEAQNGEVYKDPAQECWDWNEDDGVSAEDDVSLRVGKAKAGRLLDGVLHDAVPGSEAIYG